MFKDVPDFYPTPKSLINTMLRHIDFRTIRTVLEPSAGRGDLVEGVIEKLKAAQYSHYGRNQKAWDVDCIEINQNLQHILKGKNYRVVHNDFLTYHSFKKYDLIVANFPFSNGEKHLLKALELQPRQIVCLLNAETIKNPYSNTRKDLLRKLDELEADIEFVDSAFIGAERSTSVEVALIKINLPEEKKSSVILENLKQEEAFREEKSYDNHIVHSDFLKGIVEQYNFEVKAGLRLIAEYNAMKPYILSNLKEEKSNPILELGLHYKDDSSTLENGYIKQVRSKYWKALFDSKEFMGLFTSNLREKYYQKVDELKDYDFSLHNIYTIRIELSKEMTKGIEDTILNLFEEFSHKHYYDESSKNIHLFNGWKTNKSWKINKKVIIPLNGYGWFGDYSPTDYKVREKLEDLEKTFNYLDQGRTEHIDLEKTLKTAQHYGETKKIDTKYFLVTFYKKGTCHIEFKDLDLLAKFNLFAAQRKNWLPPNYGKSSYKDMTQEEKSVVDSFEGEKSYKEVMQNRDYYLVETSQLLQLTS